MISWYLSLKPDYKWRPLCCIETSLAFTSSQNKDAEVGTDKVAPPSHVSRGRNYNTVFNSKRLCIFTR